MKIVVCVKQVPDTADIRWTDKGTMIREGVESILNPFDGYALETAIRIKEANPGSTLTAVTMGPPQASEILRKAIAAGADDGILVSDRKFAGADTQATSRTLAAAIKEKVGEYDLIICGQYAIDGDTAQTGPSIAEHLKIAQITYVKEVESSSNEAIVVKREVEEGIQKIELKLPGVICMLKCDYEPRKPLIRGYMKASRAQIPSYGMEDLGLSLDQVGFKGSPTYVSKSFRPELREAGEMIEEQDTKQAVTVLLEKLKEKNILV